MAAAVIGAGCAFDITEVHQVPVTLVSSAQNQPASFTLAEDVKVRLGTGFATRLHAGTRWQKVGSTEYGDVYHTKDQIVTVEAADIYEANLVISNQFIITGFYLPVEKTFAPATKPVPIQTKPAML